MTLVMAQAEANRATGRLVRRRALFGCLSAVEPGGVVVVHAPAGSGKTMLLRSWIEEEGLQRRVAWVSIEPDEHDGQRFCLSVADALSSVSAAKDVLAPVTAPRDGRGGVPAGRLSSALASLEEPLVLVIDDLHELRCAEAIAWLDQLLARLPPQLVVVLATREEPRVRLHRLRLTGALTELRAADLRFSLHETRELLEGAGIALSAPGVQLLHERAEGWAAGLRLAVLSLVGHPDPERFATEFSGSERTVAGYLLAEVLHRQPAEVRELLLRTSIVDRVSGPLADFLTGGSDSQRILQELEDANAFVSSLDVGRTWFRYHQLFADLLRLELRRVTGRAAESLHRAAAQWYDAHGYVVEAIGHAQAATDWEHAAQLLADHHLSLRLEGRSATVYDLMAAFPAGAPAADPELALVFAGGRAFEGRLEESAAYLDAARRLADSVPSARRPRFDALLAGASLWHASRRQDLGASLAAMRSLEAALQQHGTALAAAGDLRAKALRSLGACELSSFELDAARRHLEQALELARRIGRPWLEIGCLTHLASLAPLSGLPASVPLELTQDAVAIAEANEWQDQPVMAAALVVRAEVLTWLGRFDDAERWLSRADRAQGPPGAPGADPGTELVIHHARGLLRLGQGRVEQALEAFRAAERIRTFLPADHRLAIESRGRMLEAQLRMGRADAAAATLAEIDESARDRAELRMTAAAIALAQGAPQRALDVLAPVIEGTARALHPAWAPIEALLLDAAANDAVGDGRAAEASLERALGLAEPDGIILPFALAPVREILERLPRHRTAHASLLTTILDVLAGRSPGAPGEPHAPTDELSGAELRVVRYLSSNLKAPEIAAELFVSANTVRTHLRHIYAKLDVHNRGEAVDRARELRLLAPPGRLVV